MYLPLSRKGAEGAGQRAEPLSLHPRARERPGGCLARRGVAGGARPAAARSSPSTKGGRRGAAGARGPGADTPSRGGRADRPATSSYSEAARGSALDSSTIAAAAAGLAAAAAAVAAAAAALGTPDWTWLVAGAEAGPRAGWAEAPSESPLASSGAARTGFGWAGSGWANSWAEVG